MKNQAKASVSSMKTVELKSLVYRWSDQSDPVLSIDNFNLDAGECVFVKGPSGSGKTTLLSAIAGVIDVPQGSVRVAGSDIGALVGGDRDRFRADHLGIVFQVFNLLPWLSALENTLLPCRFSARRRDKAGSDPKAAATRLLSELGLEDAGLINRPASALSVGQQQRVAVARALIGAPEVVLADEPTSALDEETKETFVQLLLKECRASGASLLFVSHDRSLERRFDRSIELPMRNKGNS
ncbi:MAG: ABC transporter ATP-binding protein [Falsiruegeria mediterranea]